MGCCASRPTNGPTATSPAQQPKKKAPLLEDDDGDRLVWEPRFVGDLCHVSRCDVWLGEGM